MASWQLEVGKMFLYVMIPVAAFHFFNQPDLFQEWITTGRERSYPATNPTEDFNIIEKAKKEYGRQIRERKGEQKDIL